MDVNIKISTQELGSSNTLDVGIDKPDGSGCYRMLFGKNGYPSKRNRQ